MKRGKQLDLECDVFVRIVACRGTANDVRHVVDAHGEHGRSAIVQCTRLHGFQEQLAMGCLLVAHFAYTQAV